ncbi:hypothetical protein [Halonotius roseus]|uniref:Uncharacterized protein n=1 Tax=Halonotius roseus TaxID=2511997 RepID=A0A544QRJ8_9EURY|nr:hypothetical protein [Halonotius roseus]TQQ82061.1 hypothetical protein EWF95_03735 [Halonotius roseus]
MNERFGLRFADVNLQRHLGRRLAGFLVVVAVAYAVRPLLHGLVYQTLYSPFGLLVIGTTVVAATALWFLPPLAGAPVDGMSTTVSPLLSASANQKLGLLVVVFTVGLLLGFVYSVPAGMVTERTLAQETMGEADQIQEFPRVNAENPRIAPRAVADVQTRGSVSYRTHRLGPSDIARAEDGSLAWSYAIEPDGFRNKLLSNQRGVLLSDMTRMEDREITAYDNQTFAIGEGMYLHRGSAWNLRTTDYLTQYFDDAVEFTHDGQAYMYYPKTVHEWRLTPLPHTVPVWDGGALLHTNGTIDHLSPEEAQASEILEGQRLYPLYNSRRQMESLGYRNGIINQLEVVGEHAGEVEVATLPAGAGNSQPFVIDLEGERMSYVTAMEPYGEDTRGLDEIWFIDAATGELRYFGSEGETLTGPERAMGIVRSEDSQTGWGDNFQVVEPIPVFINDELWWHSKVVPVDNTDISRSVFVSASSGEAVELGDTESVREFLAGGDADDLDNVDTEPAPDDPNVAYYIVVTDADGTEIARIPVEPGQQPSISYEPANASG